MILRVCLRPVKVRLVADLLIFVGLGAIMVWLWAKSDGALYQYVQSVHFEAETVVDDLPVGLPTVREMRPQLAPKAPNPAAPRLLPALAMLLDSDPRIVGKMEIPSIDLSVMIREGVDSATLRKAAGHLPSSVLPGEPGDFVVLGHRDTFFRPLRHITRGKTILVTTGRGRFTYVVESIQVVAPEGLILEQGPLPMSTLITCFPFNYTGAAPRRFVVKARLASSQTAQDLSRTAAR